MSYNAYYHSVKEKLAIYQININIQIATSKHVRTLLFPLLTTPSCWGRSLFSRVREFASTMCAIPYRVINSTDSSIFNPHSRNLGDISWH